ncbi:MAG: macro domain-containing protein [Clostridia bacterium]|nr:macro domain-containing protein [Clostridia bacterium]
MPFEIVRNDITKMQVDAIVNAANPRPLVGYGCDAGIHKKAGPQLLEARKKIGDIYVGQAAITPGFGLDAKYVIHAVGPVWQGGGHDEETLLRRCYDSALALAVRHKCESVAFPLLSAGNHGVPKPLALQTAIAAFSAFLMDHEMQIYLVVFGQQAFGLSEKLVQSVQSFIDENYIRETTLAEYGFADKNSMRQLGRAQIQSALEQQRRRRYKQALADEMAMAPAPSASKSGGLTELLEGLDAGFSETLLRLIDRSGKKDAEVYKRANVDRKLFSKIRNNPQYRPSKTTALAFAIALELSLEETRDLIGRAGYALSRSSKGDVIVEYFITRGEYDIFAINETLFAFDQSTLGV